MGQWCDEACLAVRVRGSMNGKGGDKTVVLGATSSLPSSKKEPLKLPPRFPRPSTSHQSSTQRDVHSRGDAASKKQLSFAMDNAVQPADMPTQQLQFPDIAATSWDLRLTRPVMPSDEYTYQAWEVQKASTGHDGVLAFPRSPEPSLRAKIVRNKHRGQGNQEEEGQWAGQRPSTSVSPHRPQPKSLSPHRPQTTPAPSTQHKARTVYDHVERRDYNSKPLLPSLLSGADQYESPEVAAWERKHLRGFHAQDGEGENLFERGGSDAMRVLRGLLMTLLSDDETYSLRKKVDLHKYAELSGRPITNAALHELCVLCPEVTALDLTGCVDVDDVGLWAIARHRPGVKELVLRGLTGLTSVGLRSLALRCADLTLLDLCDCPQLDDLAMRPLALLRKLQHLSLRNCNQLSDVGVVDAVGGEDLRSVDLTGCTSVKNFRDLVLLKLSQCCPLLERVLMPDSKGVGDRGLRGLSLQSPPRVHTLVLSPCLDVTAVGLRALTRLAPSLTHLSLSHTRNLPKPDLCALFGALPNLTRLEFSHSQDVSTAAVAVLSTSATALKRLDLHNGAAVRDQTLRALFPLRYTLQHLDVSHCPLTADGVERLCGFWTCLRSLNITGVPNITRMGLLELSRRLPYAELADTYVGFRSRPNAKKLLAESQAMSDVTRCVIKLQATARRILAKAKVAIARRDWVTKHRLNKAQALIRGHLARVRYVEMQHELILYRAAVRIQRVWHGYLVRREWRELLKQRVLDRQRLGKIETIQRVYRGFRGRKKVTAYRNLIAFRELQEAQLQAAWEVYASRIQKPWRAKLACRRVQGLRKARDTALAIKRARQHGATSMQRIFRGFQGRRRAGNARADKIRHIMEWQAARKIQTHWRIHLAKRVLYRLREEAIQQERLDAACLLQRAWRGGRGRYIALLQKKLAKLRSKEGQAATTIQRAFRGDKARKRVLAMRAGLAKDNRDHGAARLIQKIFRGHKGREGAEVERALDISRVHAKPLIEHQASIQDRLKTARHALSLHTSKLRALEVDIMAFDEEIDQCENSTALWTDSSRIHGAPQRYLTRYLRVKLREERARKDRTFNALTKRVKSEEEQCHDFERQLRMVEREIEPLLTGVQLRTSEQRSARLRSEVRRRAAAVRCMQRHVRGFLLRKALGSWYRDYWIECKDDATDGTYYFNTWSQETRWTRPYEMVVSKRILEGRGNPGEGLPHGWIRKKEPALKLSYYYNEAKHEFRWEAPANPGAGATQGATRSRLSTTRVYDASWFNRQNKTELSARSHRTRPIGLYWEERRDPETGVTFYLQPVTNDARWSLSPRSAIADQTDLAGKTAIMYSVPGASQVQASPFSTAASVTSAVDGEQVGGWVRVLDNSGAEVVEYYYNTATGQSQWNRPIGYVDEA